MSHSDGEQQVTVNLNQQIPADESGVISAIESQVASDGNSHTVSSSVHFGESFFPEPMCIVPIEAAHGAKDLVPARIAASGIRGMLECPIAIRDKLGEAVQYDEDKVQEITFFRDKLGKAVQCNGDKFSKITAAIDHATVKLAESAQVASEVAQVSACLLVGVVDAEMKYHVSEDEGEKSQEKMAPSRVAVERVPSRQTSSVDPSAAPQPRAVADAKKNLSANTGQTNVNKEGNDKKKATRDRSRGAHMIKVRKPSGRKQRQSEKPLLPKQNTSRLTSLKSQRKANDAKKKSFVRFSGRYWNGAYETRRKQLPALKNSKTSSSIGKRKKGDVQYPSQRNGKGTRGLKQGGAKSNSGFFFRTRQKEDSPINDSDNLASKNARNRSIPSPKRQGEAPFQKGPLSKNDGEKREQKHSVSRQQTEQAKTSSVSRGLQPTKEAIMRKVGSTVTAKGSKPVKLEKNQSGVGLGQKKEEEKREKKPTNLKGLQKTKDGKPQIAQIVDSNMTKNPSKPTDRKTKQSDKGLRDKKEEEKPQKMISTRSSRGAGTKTQHNREANTNMAKNASKPSDHTTKQSGRGPREKEEGGKHERMQSSSRIAQRTKGRKQQNVLELGSKVAKNADRKTKESDEEGVLDNKEEEKTDPAASGSFGLQKTNKEEKPKAQQETGTKGAKRASNKLSRGLKKSDQREKEEEKQEKKAPVPQKNGNIHVVKVSHTSRGRERTKDKHHQTTRQRSTSKPSKARSLEREIESKKEIHEGKNESAPRKESVPKKERGVHVVASTSLGRSRSRDVKSQTLCRSNSKESKLQARGHSRSKTNEARSRINPKLQNSRPAVSAGHEKEEEEKTGLTGGAYATPSPVDENQRRAHVIRISSRRERSRSKERSQTPSKPKQNRNKSAATTSTKRVLSQKLGTTKSVPSQKLKRPNDASILKSRTRSQSPSRVELNEWNLCAPQKSRKGLDVKKKDAKDEMTQNATDMRGRSKSNDRGVKASGAFQLHDRARKGGGGNGTGVKTTVTTMTLRKRESSS